MSRGSAQETETRDDESRRRGDARCHRWRCEIALDGEGRLTVGGMDLHVDKGVRVPNEPDVVVVSARLRDVRPLDRDPWIGALKRVRQLCDASTHGATCLDSAR